MQEKLEKKQILFFCNKKTSQECEKLLLSTYEKKDRLVKIIAKKVQTKPHELLCFFGKIINEQKMVPPFLVVN